MRIVDTTTRVNHPTWELRDDDGALVGTLARRLLGKGHRPFYAAKALDGCDLGSHEDWDRAVAAVADDAEAGRPRSPRNPTERYRPLYDGPKPLRRY
jgi:hypothetical protein